MHSKPAELGYRMPAEWETHAATQLHWPSNRETWPGIRLQRVEQVYLDIIEVLHKYEPVVLLIDSGASKEYVKEKLMERSIDSEHVNLFQVPINDVWARDCGPIFVKKTGTDEDFVITNWGYNAWGEKYPLFDSDNKIPEWFAETFDIPLYNAGMVLEGGSIETNGEGLFMTTESVLLNKNRNPELSKKEIENRLMDYLGAEEIIWLKNGLAGDDTDGHIDDLSRFLNKNTIVTMVTDDESDVNYYTLQENFSILKQIADKSEHELNIVTLPLPETKIEDTTVDGSEYVPASYANFYIANGVVLVPLYDSKTDSVALELLNKFFPRRDVVGISCADLVWGQGSIHCITQQLYGLK